MTEDDDLVNTGRVISPNEFLKNPRLNEIKNPTETVRRRLFVDFADQIEIKKINKADLENAEERRKKQVLAPKKNDFYNKPLSKGKKKAKKEGKKEVLSDIYNLDIESENPEKENPIYYETKRLEVKLKRNKSALNF